MSEWTNSDARIDIPYDCTRKFVCVEHPAKVENADKALQTIGGNENVSKIFRNLVKRLPLQWRPEDTYCKPVYADRIAVTNLLLKVKSRRRKSDGKQQYMVEIIGPIEVTYKFQGMCDFQYMPVKCKGDGLYEDILEHIQINSLIDRKDYLGRPVPLHIPPVAFSRVDKPCDFLYRQSIEHRGFYKNPDTNRPPNLIGTVRQRRSLHTIFVNFGEAIPTGPIQEAVKRMNADFVDKEGEAAIRKLLDEKPLWLKVELEHRTGYRGEKLKTFLPALCFYWLDGPWRAQWNKFGYDPTKEKSAKMHQTIDFRIRQAKPGQLKVKAKRTDLRINQWNMTTRNQKQNVKIDLDALGEDAKVAIKKQALIDRELYYKFKPDKVPPHRMMYYPVHYVLIDEVQKLAHENDGKEKECTDKDGWCVKGFHDKTRDYMYSYLNILLQRDDSLQMRFWRSNKVKQKKARLSLESGDESQAPSSEGATPGTSQSGQGAEGGNQSEASNDGQTSESKSKKAASNDGGEVNESNQNSDESEDTDQSDEVSNNDDTESENDDHGDDDNDGHGRLEIDEGKGDCQTQEMEAKIT